MSVDTRTPRSSTGGRSPGFDEDVLNTVRVPSDPAQVIVNHASFRVKLGATAPEPRFDVDDTAPMPVIPTSVRSAAEARMPRRRRAAPVVWTGHTEPGDPAATQLLQAVRSAGATQLLPRIDERLLGDDPDDGMPPVRPAVVAPRAPILGEPLRGARPARVGLDDDTRETSYRPQYAGAGGSPYGQSFAPPYDAPETYDRDFGRAEFDEDFDEDEEQPELRRDRRRREPVRHAWYPGRRMNLGVVLLPLRVFLGFISVYAGLGKLCDPVYFDGGQRGSMVHWLTSLHPWSVAEPLRTAALDHPVGAGLTVAFFQVAVGVLTMMGLWQRVAAMVGALLSVALLVTVSWRTAPVYNAPDIIYLAAWSPLVIAGAPVYSVDSRLAGEAWRRLGPRAPLWDLRRYVLRRGAVLATVVAGGTLLIGALVGSAVRASETHLDTPPAPTDLPTNDQLGSPLPATPGTSSPPVRHSRLPGAPGAKSAKPSASTGSKSYPAGATGAPGTSRLSGGLGGHRLPSQGETVQAPRAEQSVPHTATPENSGPSGGNSSGTGSLGGLLGSKSPTGWLLGMPGEHRTSSAGIA
jgi:uncharacterized membrane protein YphA (DoxX/SURF4 family)